MTRTIDQLEAARLALQARLDADKSAAERNQLGQFATPPALARDIVRVGRALLGARKTVHFLDPAIGTGAFYAALCAEVPAARVGRCLGFELDPHYAGPAIRLWQGTPLDLRVADFTRALPPGRARDRANLVICNPPYVRHHHMRADDKQRLQRAVSERLGFRPSGLAGLYCYFLWLADAWLIPGGVAAWLIPGEWMDVNYGAHVQQYLTRHVRLRRVHRFDPGEVQFDDALVSSTVVCFEKAAPRAGDAVELSYGGSLSAPARVQSIDRASLVAARKWSRLTAATRPPRAASRARTLDDLFAIKRGIATGANHFFVLSPDAIRARGLSMDFFRPILPGPRRLERDEIEPLDNGDPDLRDPRFLLTIDAPEETIRARHPRLWRYLQEGAEQGIDQRYLCRHRRPWYAQEHRPPAPILCTYMGRTTRAGERPFRFLFNRSRATAANVYLLLYPRPALERATAADPGLMRTLWTALSAVPTDVLLGEGRVYGGGLHKLEPRELARVPLASLALDRDTWRRLA